MLDFSNLNDLDPELEEFFSKREIVLTAADEKSYYLTISGSGRVSNITKDLVSVLGLPNTTILLTNREILFVSDGSHKKVHVPVGAFNRLSWGGQGDVFIAHREGGFNSGFRAWSVDGKPVTPFIRTRSLVRAVPGGIEVERLTFTWEQLKTSTMLPVTEDTLTLAGRVRLQTLSKYLGDRNWWSILGVIDGRKQYRSPDRGVTVTMPLSEGGDHNNEVLGIAKRIALFEIRPVRQVIIDLIDLQASEAKEPEKIMTTVHSKRQGRYTWSQDDGYLHTSKDELTPARQRTKLSGEIQEILDTDHGTVILTSKEIVHVSENAHVCIPREPGPVTLSGSPDGRSVLICYPVMNAYKVADVATGVQQSSFFQVKNADVAFEKRADGVYRAVVRNGACFIVQYPNDPPHKVEGVRDFLIRTFEDGKGFVQLACDRVCCFDNITRSDNALVWRRGNVTYMLVDGYLLRLDGINEKTCGPTAVHNANFIVVESASSVLPGLYPEKVESFIFGRFGDKVKLLKKVSGKVELPVKRVARYEGGLVFSEEDGSFQHCSASADGDMAIRLATSDEYWKGYTHHQTMKISADDIKPGWESIRGADWTPLFDGKDQVIGQNIQIGKTDSFSYALMVNPETDKGVLRLVWPGWSETFYSDTPFVLQEVSVRNSAIFKGSDGFVLANSGYLSILLPQDPGSESLKLGFQDDNKAVLSGIGQEPIPLPPSYISTKTTSARARDVSPSFLVWKNEDGWTLGDSSNHRTLSRSGEEIWSHQSGPSTYWNHSSEKSKEAWCKWRSENLLNPSQQEWSLCKTPLGDLVQTDKLTVWLSKEGEVSLWSSRLKENGHPSLCGELVYTRNFQCSGMMGYFDVCRTNDGECLISGGGFGDIKSRFTVAPDGSTRFCIIKDEKRYRFPVVKDPVSFSFDEKRPLLAISRGGRVVQLIARFEGDEAQWNIKLPESITVVPDRKSIDLKIEQVSGRDLGDLAKVTVQGLTLYYRLTDSECCELLSSGYENSAPQEESFESYFLAPESFLESVGSSVLEGAKMAFASQANSAVTGWLSDKLGLDSREPMSGALLSLIGPSVALVASETVSNAALSETLRLGAKRSLSSLTFEKVSPVLNALRPKMLSLAEKAQALVDVPEAVLSESSVPERSIQYQ